MSVKILGGEFRGFSLETPRQETTRPTSVLVRRKLYDWRQHLHDYTFIDLCAGSGAMGFEALSRGAEKVFCNDMVRGAFLTLKKNQERLLHSFRLDSDRVKVSSMDASLWIQKELLYEVQDTSSCIVFLDPPYEKHEIYFAVLKALREVDFRGELWLESDTFKGPKKDDLTRELKSIVKVVEHGDHFVVVGKVV